LSLKIKGFGAFCERYISAEFHSNPPDLSNANVQHELPIPVFRWSCPGRGPHSSGSINVDRMTLSILYEFPGGRHGCKRPCEKRLCLKSTGF
jgi:hypothetical protein